MEELVECPPRKCFDLYGRVKVGVEFEMRFASDRKIGR